MPPSPDRTVSQLLADAESAKARGDSAKHAEALRQAAGLLVKEGNTSGAIDLLTLSLDYRRAAELADQIKDTKRAAQLWYLAGDYPRAARARLHTNEDVIAAELFERGGELLEAARIHEQREDFVRAAGLYERAGQRDKAADTLLRALSAGGTTRLVGPEAQELCRRAAVLYAHIGQIERAVGLLRKSGQNLFAGQLLARAGRHEEAIQLLAASGDTLAAAEVARAAGQERRAFFLLGERAEAEGRLGVAATHFAQAEDFPRAARLYEFAGDVPRAAAVHEQAKQFDAAASLYERMGRVEDAVRCLRMGGRTAEAAALLERVRQRDDAIRALAAAGDTVRAAAGLVARARAGERARYPEAINLLSRVSPQSPEFARARTLLAEVLSEQGDHRGALNVLHQLLHNVRPSKEHVPALYHYGRLLEREGYLAEARNVYRTAASLDPNFMDISQRMPLLGHTTEVPEAMVEALRSLYGQKGQPARSPSGAMVPIQGAHAAWTVPKGAPAGAGRVASGVHPAYVAGAPGSAPPQSAGAPRQSQGAAQRTAAARAASPGAPGQSPTAPAVVPSAPMSFGTPSKEQAPAGAAFLQPDSETRADVWSDDQIVEKGESQNAQVAALAATPAPHPGQAELGARPESLLGIVLRGRFRIEKKIGVGAQAQVYLARDMVLDRPVAIKVLNDSLGAQSSGLDRFVTEARLAAKIRHAGCIAIYDFGQERGLTFMAMEYFEGETLGTRLKKGPIEPLTALRIARDVAEALAAAHAEGIVHRDVKPANILVDAAGRVRLADFGVAKNLLGDATSTGLMIGTLAYMAPEQARGGPADHRADIFALGVVLHEMLTGQPPFESTIESLIVRVQNPPPELPTSVPVPSSVRSMIVRCLQPAVSARYQTTRELIDDLNAASAALGAPAPEESFGARSGEFSVITDDVIVDEHPSRDL